MSLTNDPARRALGQDKHPSVNVHFSDFFEIDPKILDDYGAFNVSLINDLPLFIDPFLIFNSPKPHYQALHNQIIRYLRFLRDKSLAGHVDEGLLQAWFRFGEVKQSWLGFSRRGNQGSGLGPRFANALNHNLVSIFHNFGEEHVTRGSHLEKVCLIAEGVGKDNISDFTTNLIKDYLAEYTQTFAREHLRPEFRRCVAVEKVRFNYATETWERDWYELPFFNSDFIILTPKDLLTKEDIWISRADMYSRFHEIAAAVSNEQLRAQVNNYLSSILSPSPTKEEMSEALKSVFRQFPELIEHYIRYKEDTGDLAEALSDQNVQETYTLYVKQIEDFVERLAQLTHFYQLAGDTYEEAMSRVVFLKSFIEHKDGYRLFYLDGKPVKREEDLQLLFRLTWYGTQSDVNREVNNGRGPVDYKISRGGADSSLVEFKLASNTQLKRNLEKQVPIYEQASDTERSIKVIVFFSEREHQRVRQILKDLGFHERTDIVLIDARADNKPSASKA